MVNKSTSIYIKNTVLALALLPAIAVSEVPNNCVLDEVITSETVGSINLKSNLDVKINATEQLAGKDTGLTCVVTYNTTIGNQIFKAEGQYSWDGKDNVLDSCKLAEQQADQNVIKKINQTRVTSSSTLHCNDQINTVFEPVVGAVGNRSQFQIDTKYPGTFKYKGTDCYRFTTTEFSGKDLVNLNGVACEVGKEDLVVVDKW